MKEFDVLQGVVQLTEHSDIYLAVDVPKFKIEYYLQVMQQFLAENDLQTYLANQQLRDKQKYHITIVSPIEYNSEFHNILIGKMVTYSLVGLGRVIQDEDDVFFIIVDSPDMEKLRQQVQLPKRDFHVTLGFKNTDIHDVAKDRSTLIHNRLAE